MGKGPKNAGDPSARCSPELSVLGGTEALRNHHDLQEAVNEHGALADRLCSTFNIPKEHHADLCAALQCACDAYDHIKKANARRVGLQANVKHLRGFQRKVGGAFKEYGLIDESTRTTISRAVVAKLEDATGLGPSILRRLTVEQLGAEMLEAVELCLDHSRAPRGRPSDTALIAFVTVLRQFWVEKLKRPFSERFEEDWESMEWVPVNDASRFVVEAVEHLIGDHVRVGTCRWKMRQVSSGA